MMMMGVGGDYDDDAEERINKVKKKGSNREDICFDKMIGHARKTMSKRVS